jgi:CRISPR/Cas system type I-B associated protein Csh2 (Cas7 group RAMP superfamily)
MGLDGMLYYRQTKPAATGISRPILVNTIKALEKVRLIAKRHTRPIVMHRDNRFATVAMGFNHHVDTGLSPMLKRIIN